MIKNRNMGDFIIELTLPGIQTSTATLNTGAASAVVPFAGRISAVFARMQTQGTTGTQNVDLLKNGTSLTSASGLFNFPSTVGGTTAPTYTTANLLTNPPTVAKGDIISVLNKTIHTGTAAQFLTVYLNVERARTGTFNDAMQTDTIGSDSDAI